MTARPSCATRSRANYNYGHVMAKAGFITFAIDWIGFGERNDNQKPNYRKQVVNQDWCDQYDCGATMLGTAVLAISITHDRSAVDFTCSLPFMDSVRHPWILLPVVFVVMTVLMFNFLGDGLRDATDPYAR